MSTWDKIATVKLESKEIWLDSPYDPRIIEVIKAIPGRKWNHKASVWILPFTEYHSQRVISDLVPMGFDVEPRIVRMAEKNKKVTVTYMMNREGLFPFQSEAVDFTHKAQGRVILSDEMGLGKTIEALGWIRERPDLKDILIVCPASVVYKWANEIKKWISRDETVEVITTGTQELTDCRFHIMSYAIMVAQHQNLIRQEWDVLLLDECFPGDVMVHTDRGLIRIDEIVENKLDVSVLSCNSLSNVVEYKKVYNWIKKPLLGNLVKIKHQYGELICTENHPIFIEGEGYVTARAIKSGTNMRILREKFFDGDERESNSSILQSNLCKQIKLEQPSISRSYCNQGKTMQNTENLSGLWNHLLHCSFRYQKILFNKVFSNRQVVQTRKQINMLGKNEKSRSWWGLEREKKPILVSANENKQSNVDARSEGENDCIIAGQNFSISRREREDDISTIGVTPTNRRGVGICNYFTSMVERRISINPKLLQGGYWNTEKTSGNRGRRKDTQTKEMEILRQKENRNYISSRVESVEIYQRGDRQGSDGSYSGDQFVYCLDVEDNHNFFADGVLVHNCHKIKNPSAQRTRCAKSLQFKHCLLLTGTPMMNRPSELFSLLNMLNPVEWDNFFQYAQRYCDAKKSYFGWDFTGASNLNELRDRMKFYMIRRTKKEVLTQLPELTRTRIPVAVKKHEIDAALKSLQHWIKENGHTNGGRAEAMVRLSKLRQAIGLAKVPIVLEMVEDILEQSDTQKIVIYAVHKSVVQLLLEGLKNWGVSSITGETSQEERQLRVDNFQNHARPRVMVISSAGGEGIDLFKADRIVFCEREFTHGAEEQAEARCHRMGQKNAVEAIYLIADATVDRDMDALVERKREIFQELIGSDKVSTIRNTVDEFLDLIQKRGG